MTHKYVGYGFDLQGKAWIGCDACKDWFVEATGIDLFKAIDLATARDVKDGITCSAYAHPRTVKVGSPLQR